MLRRLLASALAPAAAAGLVLGFPAALGRLAARPEAGLLLDVLRATSWVLPLLTGLLAWRHGRSRLVFAAWTLAAIAWAVSAPRSALDPRDPLTALVLLLAATATFLLIGRFEERGLWTRIGWARLAGLSGWTFLVGRLLLERPDWLEWALDPLGRVAAPLGRTPWSPLAIALTLLAGAACLFSRRRDRTEVGPALLLALLATAAGLTAASGRVPALDVPLAATAFFGAASLVLLQGLHALAWRHGNVDELTRLPSRRALGERLPQLSGTYAVAVLDLDHFKKVNDRHGHEAGDVVLREVAQVLSRLEGGTVFRSGGEEFVALFPGRDLDAALEPLEALRREVAGLRIAVPPLPGRKPRELRVSVSIGAAQRTRHDPSPERVIAAADSALLRAKKTGRDRVCTERRSSGRRERRSASRQRRKA